VQLELESGTVRRPLQHTSPALRIFDDVVSTLTNDVEASSLMREMSTVAAASAAENMPRLEQCGAIVGHVVTVHTSDLRLFNFGMLILVKIIKFKRY